MNDPTEMVRLPLAVAILEGETVEASYFREGRPKEVVAKPQVVTSTAIYDGLAALYNDASIGALLVVDLPNKPTTGNLHKVLCGRELVRDHDYCLFRAKADIHGNNFGPRQRPLVLEKLTDAPMKVPPNRAYQARIMADAAAVRGAQDLRLLHAVPKAGNRMTTLVDLPVVRKDRPLTATEEFGNRLMEGRMAEYNPLDAEADRELRAIRLPDLDMGQ
jgi:hypothetical protein